MNNDVNFYGKVAQFPKNVKAQSAYNFLTNIKISKKKLWYFIIEKDNESENKDLQLIKYNNKEGINCSMFLEQLKEYYKNNEEIKPYLEQLVIDKKGEEKFSIIKNIPNVEINNKKLISIITEDLIKLLYK